MSATEQEDPPRERMRPVDPRLLRYSTASRGFFAITAATVLAQTGVIIGFAWLLTAALVGAIEGTPISQLAPLAAGAAGLVLLRGLLIAATERTSARGAARASLELRRRLVAALAALGPDWLSRRNAAGLAVTAGHGLDALDAYFGRYLPQLVATAITMPILVLAILIADPLSGVVVVITLPLIPVFMVLIGLATSAVQKRQYGTLRRLATRFADTVSGLGTLKVFGRQHRASRSIETVTDQYKRETMSVLRVSFLSGFALEFLASISVAIVAVEIGFRLLDGRMDLLTGLFVLLLAPEAYLPLRQVGVQFHAASEGVAATDEIFSVLDAATTARGRDTRAVVPTDPRVATPRVRLRGVRVRRGERTLPAVDAAADGGEVLLIEGPSGSGKSSIVAAMLGFADVDGDLEVSAGRASGRDAIAWAGQRPGLIAGTVAQNIALGATATDPSELRRALADAAADEIDPDLELGAMGAGLSGGQAQRVAVARALYRLRTSEAGVLVLDEPTSALDAQTEALLWRTVRGIADEGSLVVLVSHRPSARGIADRIVRLDSAEVTA